MKSEPIARKVRVAWREEVEDSAKNCSHFIPFSKPLESNLVYPDSLGAQLDQSLLESA